MDQQKMREMNLVEIEDDLTPEERAYWEASIERDMRNPNRGKVHRPIGEFWQKLEAELEKDLKKRYEGLSC